MRRKSPARPRESLAQVFAKELRGRQITVNAVAPGPVASELFVKG